MEQGQQLFGLQLGVGGGGGGGQVFGLRKVLKREVERLAAAQFHEGLIYHDAAYPALK